MTQTFNATNSGTGATVMDNLLANTNTLRSSFSGTTTPTGPVVGQLHLDVDGGGTNIDILKVYYNPDNSSDGFVEVGTELHGDMTFHASTANTSKKIINAGFETRGTDLTPAAGNVGARYHHTGISKEKVVSDASTIEVIESGSNADGIRLALPLEAWSLGSTAPTASSVGTTPKIRARLFDAVGEKMSAGFRVPAGYSGDADLKARLFFSLATAESANATIGVTCAWIAKAMDSAEVLNGTSLTVVATTDIGNNTTQHSPHKVDVVLDYDNGTTPISAGDWLALEFGLNSVSGVADVNFIGAEALVPYGSKSTETI